MLIKRLKLHNFRQYKGDQSIEFSTDPKCNVTVILGDNTFGKTTLLQAFYWCLYDTVNLDKPDSLLNYDIEYSMDNGSIEEVFVEIVLIHSNMEYIITRSEEFKMVEGELQRQGSICRVSYCTDDGQVEPLPVRQTEVKKIIRTILPQDLSSYFFFDTERVRNVNERKDLAESVKGLLGLTVLDNAIRHLGSKSAKKSVLGQFYSSIDSDGDARAREALKRIQDAQERKDSIAERLSAAGNEIENYEIRKVQLEEILRDNQTTAQLQKQKEDLEAAIKRDEFAFTENTSMVLKEFSQNSVHFFTRSLVRRAQDFLSAAKISDKGIKDLTRITLDEIILRGKCICGTDLKEGSEALASIKNEMRFASPENLGSAVRYYKERLDNYCRASELTYENIESRCKTLLTTKTRIQEGNDEVDNISREISGKENMSRYEAELVDVKRRLKDLSNKKDQLIRDDQRQIGDIEKYQKIFDGTAVVSDKNKNTMLSIRYAESIQTWLASTYKEKEDDIRLRLEDKVNSLFKRMYHGQRRVVLDSKYQVSLLTSLASDLEIHTGESEGLNRVKNFAFISGLVSLAKERIVSNAGESELDLSSEPYPLVMDAPFSNADEKHISNISEVLPDVAEQVIMFVMKKDWQYAEPVLRNRVGSQHQLIKHSEKHSVLERGSHV